MKKLIPFILLFCTNLTFAQVNFIWEKEIGGGEDDWGYGLCFSHDEQYVFTGITASYDEEVPDSLGGTDVWLGKMSTDSTMIWSHVFGGTSNERGNDVQLTPDNGFLITGFTESNDIDISGNHGSKDLFVCKTDFGGHLEWFKVFGGTSDEIGNSVLPLADGNFIVAGSTFSSDGDISQNIGSSDYWIIKLDADGNLIWEKTFGGTGEDRAKKIIQTQDGNFVALGTAFSNDGDVDNSLGSVDFWLIKIDPNGNLMWNKNFGGSMADQGFDLIETSNGNLVLTGEVRSNDGNVVGNHGFTDAWIARLTSDGDILWQNSLGGTNVDYFLAIQETDDGGLLATGNTFSDNGDVSVNLGASDVWLVKLSPNGQLLWEKTIGYDLNEIGNAVISSGNDIILWGGIQVDHLRHGNSDAYIVKLHAPLTSIIPLENQMSLSVYPNPSQDFIQISNDKIISSYTLYDITGRKVQEAISKQTDVIIPLLEVPKGKYVLVVELDSGDLISAEILVK